MMTPPLSFFPKFGEMGRDGCTTTIVRTKRGGDALSVLTHNGAEESNDPLFFYFVKRSKCVAFLFSVVVGRDCAKRTVVEIFPFFKCPVRW